MYWTTGSGLIELNITEAQAASAAFSGRNDDAVLALSQTTLIARQLRKLDVKLLADELREYGAWDDAELANHEHNLQRILWLACQDIKEGD